MPVFQRILLFLFLNFSALGLGGFFTGSGVPSAWYQNLAKAPWTPPGWVFGFAWTGIMLCFSLYMAFLWNRCENKKNLILLYGFQWGLNVLWNPVFFHFHQTGISMAIITALSMLVGYLTFRFRMLLNLKSLLLLPYLVWLLIASSLNAYIVLYN